MIRSEWVEKDIYKTLAPTKCAEGVSQSVGIKRPPVMMWAAQAQEFMQAPAFVERYKTSAEGPVINTSESNSSCQKLLPSCLCPKESAGLQPLTQEWQNSREDEQAKHDQSSEEMSKKGLRAVKIETTTRKPDKDEENGAGCTPWKSLLSGRRKMQPGLQGTICFFL